MHSRAGILTLTLATALTVIGAAREAHAAKVEGHFEPGALVAQGFSEIGVRPTLGGDVNVWWSPLRGLDLGLESGMAVTRLPYGSSDGEPVLGARSGEWPSVLSESTALLPRMMVGSRFFPLANTWMGAFVGTTFIMSGAAGEHSLLPFPTGSVAIETRFGDQGRYGVRAACSYLYYLGPERAFIMPTVAFTWGT